MRGSVATQVFSLLLSLRLTDGFKIVSTSQTEKVYRPGDTVTLVCRTDSYWEYCTWSHKQRQCNLEWKYSKGDVTKQDCHGDLDPRLSYSGDYEQHECSITITGLQQGDAGVWSCEMESYVLGSTRGYKSKNKIEVVIEEKSTTAHATKSTTTTTTTESLPTTQSSTTTEGTTTASTTSTTEKIKILPDPDYSDSEDEESQHRSDDTDTEDIDPEEVVTALPVSDLEAAPSQTPAGLIAGVIVCLAAMGLVSAGLGVTYYRRRKSHRAIISYLQAEREDAMASNAFLEEAEYHISIIRDPQSLPLAVSSMKASDILDNSVSEAPVTVSDSKET